MRVAIEGRRFVETALFLGLFGNKIAIYFAVCLNGVFCLCFILNL